MRLPVAALVSVGLLVLVVPPAHSETWTAPDRRADVRAFRYDPDAGPCDRPRVHRFQHDKRRDITELSVDHGEDAVLLTLSMREVSKRDASTHYTLHLRTPERAFYVDVMRFEPGGELRLFLAKEPDYPSPSEIEGCSFAIVVGELLCEGLTGEASTALDQVSVMIPRKCLGGPRWVRAAGGVHGFTKTDAQGRFTTLTDVWAPAGVRRHGFLPPFGPRVRQG